jgi:hypothetical protein
MQRKTFVGANERNETVKRIKYSKESVTGQGSPEMPDDVWFLIFDLVDSLYILCLLSSASKTFCSLCQRYKNARNIKPARLTSAQFSFYFAENGWLNCLQYMVENGVNLEGYTSFVAADKGHYSCVAFACDNGAYLNEELCETAASIGCLDIIKYAQVHGCEFSWRRVAFNAALRGHKHILQHIPVEELKELAPAAMSFAATEGRLDCLKYLHEISLDWGDFVCESSANPDNLDCIKYAHENGARWSNTTTLYAAYYGQLDTLIYAHEQGAPWDESTCSNAARNGFLDCMIYAHENGAQWGDACSVALRYGNMECMIYAREHGAMLDVKELDGALFIDGNCLQYAGEEMVPDT